MRLRGKTAKAAAGSSPCHARRLGAGVLAILVALPFFASGARAACLGGGTSSLPVPTVEFLRSYRASFSTPTRLAVDDQGNIYVADAPRGTVTVRSPDGRILARVGGLSNPVSVGADAFGHFYVGDGTNGSVAAWSLSGDFLLELGQGAGEFGMPADIGIDATTGNIYVTDSTNDSVKIYNFTGAFLASFGGYGSGDGEFNFPAGIFVDGDNDEVLVVDQLNFRIQSFALEATCARARTAPGGISTRRKASGRTAQAGSSWQTQSTATSRSWTATDRCCSRSVRSARARGSCGSRWTS